MLLSFVKKFPISPLLLLIPVTLIAEWLHWGSVWVFVLSAVSIVPLAGFVGKGTEALSENTGPKLGGFFERDFGECR